MVNVKIQRLHPAIFELLSNIVDMKNNLRFFLRRRYFSLTKIIFDLKVA